MVIKKTIFFLIFIVILTVANDNVLPVQEQSQQEYSFRIPSSFKQNGKKITIKIDNRYCDSSNAYGIFSNRKKLILFREDITEDSISIEQTFFHELIHCILEQAKYNELSKDEKLVSRLSLYLWEALNTMEYNDSTLNNLNKNKKILYFNKNKN
jgi:hypothetical protein